MTSVVASGLNIEIHGAVGGRLRYGRRTLDRRVIPVVPHAGDSPHKQALKNMSASVRRCKLEIYLNDALIDNMLHVKL